MRIGSGMIALAFGAAMTWGTRGVAQQAPSNVRGATAPSAGAAPASPAPPAAETPAAAPRPGTPAETAVPASPAGSAPAAAAARPSPEGSPAPATPPPAPPAAPSPAATAASAGASLSTGAVSVEAAPPVPAAPAPAAHVDAGEGEPKASTPAVPPTAPVIAGSNIRRPLQLYEGTPVIDSPLAVEMQNRDYMQMRRQFTGIAVPDDAAALGLYAPGTSSFLLREQPTLVLLNGRRLISSPMPGPDGADFVDMNQIPISLIDHVEFSKGNQSSLYGADATGGVVNVVTKRTFKGVELDGGAQATDTFSQHTEDVTLTLGTGDQHSGMSSMVSYFTSQPLKATDRPFIEQRADLMESLLSFPGSFRPLSGGRFVVPDPACNLAKNKLGIGAGLETRLPDYGPVPKSGDISSLSYIPQARRTELISEYDSRILNPDGSIARDRDGLLQPDEISTFCTGDFARHYDLVLKEQRIQTYNTFWHGFTKHTEGFGELGYYRNANENRAAPSFPILTGDENVFVPADSGTNDIHQDIPTGGQYSPVPNPLILASRIQGNYQASQINSRRLDVWRGVLGLRGDFKDAAAGSVAESWDWELAGTYSISESISRVPDVITSQLIKALNSCSGATITERQEAGCYNPFFSSALNNAVINPLGVDLPSGVKTSPSINGYPATDTNGNGIQDGGFICDPNDPAHPCPAGFDPANAGTVNTAAVIDRLMGQSTQISKKTLFTLDGVLRGDLFDLPGGKAAYAAGGQARRETLNVDYDETYNQKDYAFLYGGPDVHAPGRDIFAGFGELRLPLVSGLELQGAGRYEHYQKTGGALGASAGLALRPFALGGNRPPEALKYLLVRGGVAHGFRAPSLLQMYGTYTTFEEVYFHELTTFRPYTANGNPHLKFETTDTANAGLQWDFKGAHAELDGWLSKIHNIVATDNPRRLIYDCTAATSDRVDISYRAYAPFGDCPALSISPNQNLVEMNVQFDNMADVTTNGLDGILSYTLDTKRRGMGDAGTFFLGVLGTYLNSYKIEGARVLREQFRTLAEVPDPANTTQKVAYGPGAVPRGATASFQAAGERNLDNFAPPLPKLRLTIPLRWSYGDHTVGITARYISGYRDGSEHTVFELGQPMDIASMTVFDVMYGFAFGEPSWHTRLQVGVINVFGTDPPVVDGSLTGIAYEVGVHDPRGRIVYARATATF